MSHFLFWWGFTACFMHHSDHTQPIQACCFSTACREWRWKSLDIFAHRLFISDYSGVDYKRVKLGWISAEWDRIKAARSSRRIKGNISWVGPRSECVSLMESHVSLVALRDVCPEKHLRKDLLSYPSGGIYSQDKDSMQLWLFKLNI